MRISLYHKNIRVLDAEYDATGRSFLRALDVHSYEHLPVGVKGGGWKNFEEGLNFWWKSRMLPKNRSKYISFEGGKDSFGYGFNLSDQYWLKPENSGMSWSKGNFFQNSFNEDLGKFIICNDAGKILRMTSDSPDFFSNGEQDKRWIVQNSKRKLLKYGRPPYYEQPFNEVLACEISRRMGFPYTDYSFVIKGKEDPVVYSVCDCFVNEDTEFVPAGFVQYAVRKEKNESSYSHLLRCCEAAGMKNLPDIETNLLRMAVLDYIIGNTDRHFGNFGFIRNAETLEWCGMAPNFDTGNSMFFEYPTSDLRRSGSLQDNVKSKTFHTSQKEQLKRLSKALEPLNLDFTVLKGIDRFYFDMLQKNPKIDNERRILLSSMLRQRVSMACGIIYSLSDVSRAFLDEIASDKSDKSLTSKAASARTKMMEIFPEKKNSLQGFLMSFDAKSPADFEMKLRKKIEERNKGTDLSPVKSKKPKAPDPDGNSGRF